MTALDRGGRHESFRKHLRFDMALTEASRVQAYRIRHEVYCEQLGFEPLRPDRLETDAHDRHSLHGLVTLLPASQEPAGCIRIVLADPADDRRALPFETVCMATIDRSIVDPRTLRREHIGEVSRLAVRAIHQQRSEVPHHIQAKHHPCAVASSQLGIPYVAVGLYLGVIAMAVRHDIHTLFLLTEPRLAAHFTKLGANLRPIGSAVEHAGIRIPAMMDVEHFIDHMRPLLRPIWEQMLQETDRSLRAHGLTSAHTQRQQQACAIA